MADKKYEKSIGALWLKSNDKGEYFTGSLDMPDGEKLRFVAFKNNRKESENHPDFRIFAAKKRDESNVPY